MPMSLRYLVLVPLVSLAACMAKPTAALDTALTGITAVDIDVAGVPRDVERYGLRAEDLAAELKSSLPGHVAFTAGARDRIVLRVNLNIAAGGYGFYSYSLRLQVERPLAVQGAEAAYVPRVVWTIGQQGVLLPPELGRLRGETKKLAQDLANALTP